jgi:hypothetical protein
MDGVAFGGDRNGLGNLRPPVIQAAWRPLHRYGSKHRGLLVGRGL